MSLEELVARERAGKEVGVVDKGGRTAERKKRRNTHKKEGQETGGKGREREGAEIRECCDIMS